MYPVELPEDVSGQMNGSCLGPIIVYVLAQTLDFVRNEECLRWLVGTAADFDGGVSLGTSEGM